MLSNQDIHWTSCNQNGYRIEILLTRDKIAINAAEVK